MMAKELLIMAVSNGGMFKGYTVVVKDSPAVWGSKERLPTFVRIVVDDAIDNELDYLTIDRIDHDFDVTESIITGKITISAKSKTVSNQNDITNSEATDIRDSLKAEFGTTDDAFSAKEISFTKGTIAVADVDAMLQDRFKYNYDQRRYYIDPVEIDKMVLASQNQAKWSKAVVTGLVLDRMQD